ncbi:MAG: GTPase [unclassified Hahellaceae]|nr:GTPase [Hahellaceae bacterium]|tara:strand:+ start:9419 stop:11221 length:1803 start_codon:yes stop_codon:yes gene_type:complete
MSGQHNPLTLKVPNQRLTTLSYAEPAVKAVESWANELPKANIGEMSKQLYHALLELNELICSPQSRFQLIEVLRPSVYYICRELGKHFLNQAVVLPEKQRKIANLAQSLQLNLANAYKLVLVDLHNAGQAEKNKKLTAPAIHRAISDLSSCVLRANQLYCQTPPDTWLELHQLYRFARDNRLLKIKTVDGYSGTQNETTVEQAYKRVLLLGCCKPNQLRQKDIETAYTAFEHWTDYVSLEIESGATALFVISPKKDLAPAYRSLQTIPPSTENYGFDTSKLAGLLTEELAQGHQEAAAGSRQSQHPRLHGVETLSEPLLLAISQAIGVLAKRSFKRTSSQGRILISVGMTATHYFVANGTDFNTFLSGDRKNTDASYFADHHRRDVWAQPGSGNSQAGSSGADLSPIRYTGASAASASKDAKAGYQQHIVPLVNTSPGGYCIQWIGDIPSNVQAGELLGVREDESHPWSIGVIRWIRQIRQHGTQFGVELLAPGAKPCGVQLLQKVGENSEFLRGLLLPELPAISQPASLVVPRLPFQVGHKVSINRQGRNTKLQLLKRISATGSFTQFEIEAQFAEAGKPAPRKTTSSEDDFDSLWPSL